MKLPAALIPFLLSSFPEIIKRPFYRSRNKGFTLLELVLVCTILGFTMAAIFPLYSFGVRAFSVGVERTDLQQNVRVGADYCTRELHFAEDIQLLNGGTRVKYSKLHDNNSYLLHRKGSELVVFVNNVENKVAYNIRSFVMELDQEKKLLRFTIIGEDGEEGFKIRSAVSLKNL